MIHVALNLISDILSHPAYEGVNVSEEEAIKCVPDSLHMFLNLMIGVIILNISVIYAYGLINALKVNNGGHLGIQDGR